MGNRSRGRALGYLVIGMDELLEERVEKGIGRAIWEEMVGKI